MSINRDKLPEIVSAFADGELSAEDAQSTKELIDSSYENSALLDMYQEISAAIKQDTEPVPENLSAGIMNAIMSGDTASHDNSPSAANPPLRIEVDGSIPENKRNATRRKILSIYMPLAACLVVMLIVYSITGDIFGLRHDKSGGAPMSVMQDAHTEKSIADEYNINADSGLNSTLTTADDDAYPPPEAAPAEAPAAPAAVPPAPGSAKEDFEQERDTGESGNIENSAGFTKITTAEADLLMQAIDPNQYVILDVRSKEEYSKNHIKDAILIPYDEISEKVYGALPDTGVIIFVYCQTGVRSAIACQTLADMGYTRVYDIDGGIDGWPQ